MSKLSKTGIENTLNIPSADELSAALEYLRTSSETQDEALYVINDEEPEAGLTVDEMKALIKEARLERTSIKQETNISARQKRLEELSQMSTKYFEDVMDKAFNTEDRFASDLLNAASNLLKVATDAETALINSDTKMAELQLKKEKQDRDANNTGLSGAQTKDINGETYTMIDRNSLLKELEQDK